MAVRVGIDAVDHQPGVEWDAGDPPPHLVQFYESDPFLVDAVARFIETGLAKGEAAVLIATESHRRALEERFRVTTPRLATAREQGEYVVLDADATLSKLMADGRPDAARFQEVVGGVVSRATGDGRRGVRAFGEMVALLWERGQPQAAIQLEELWNVLARTLPFSLFCAYPMRAFRNASDGERFLEICSAHSHLIPAESYTAVPDPVERLRAITALQQKAEALEAEAAERTHLEGELQAKLAELAEADRRKDEFLAMLGHELRNPLSAVRNAIATASLDESKRSRALEIARRQTDQLGRLVDDLLDVARITQGRIALRKEAVALSGIIERAVESTHLFTDDRGHRVTVSLPPTREIWVEADPARLDQVIVNLLSNAAKYTRPGGRIDVTAEREGREAVVRVRDSGIGIAPDLLPHVFDLFTQADRALDRVQGGLGIGLTIARRLVELHGGRIEAHSAGVDMGAEFVVRLPALAAAPQLASESATALRRSAARVLVVEDNPDGAESLMMLLELLGHEVRIVPDGLAALDAVREDPPDVMLIDIGLPGMDGYELASCVRLEPMLRPLVLVALTGYGREEDKERALAAGFDHHLTKPVAIDSLQHLLALVNPPQATGSSILQ